jgi:DNA-binding transcriptional LysR family regulator
MRTFVKVAELGSFTAAAAELYIAQQAVSQQVKSLEQALGVELLRRTPQAVTSTPAGEVFLQEAKRVLAAADRAVDRSRAGARGEVGAPFFAGPARKPGAVHAGAWHVTR